LSLPEFLWYLRRWAFMDLLLDLVELFSKAGW